MVPQSQEVHKVFVEQINPLKSRGQKYYKCTLETPVLMLWFKVLRAFLHLRDYFCSLHPKHLQGKLSLPLVDLLYVKGGDSKGYGKEQNICPEKWANSLIPRKATKWASQILPTHSNSVTHAHLLSHGFAGRGIKAIGLIFSVCHTQAVADQRDTTPAKGLGGRVHPIVLQGEGGGKLFHKVVTTCCFSDEDL